MDILDLRHRKKIQEIEKELNDKGISLNRLNNEYEQKIRELRKELNGKDISLNEYKKRLDRLDNEHKQEIQKIKKELEERDIKGKNKVLKKINELNKFNDKYIEEKQIIEQELNKKEQELNKKEQELKNNTRKINDLKNQNKLLKDGLENQKKSNESKTKENYELRDEISELKTAKVQRASIINDLKKSHEAPSTPPEILQDVRKRDNKARTFAPSHDDEMKKLAEITKAKLKLGGLKTPDVSIKPVEKPFSKIKRPEDFERERILENINKYEDINLNDANNLIDEIKKNIKMGDNVLLNIFILIILIIFYMILKMVISIILIEKKNIKKSLKILKTSSQIKKDMVNM